MNAIAKLEQAALSTQTEEELVRVLQTSLYPGAKLDSIKMVLGYCKAAGLDPMQKPVHIVPMKVSTGQKDDKGWDIKADRDVIMPGVGLYRTQAARSGAYAGVSDPEFGPTRTLTFAAERWEDGENGRRQRRTTQESIDYPEWCRVSVTRIVDGTPREFSAREYWLENYATKGSSSNEPNAMWRKRPFGQIAKCAEAQALRKAFPEMTGAQPTAEEMEGRSLDDVEGHRTGGVVDAEVVRTSVTVATYPQDKFDSNVETWKGVVTSGRKSHDQMIAFIENKGVLLTEAQKTTIRSWPCKTADKPAAAAGATDAAPKVTFAIVADRMSKAKTKDDLATAGDLIKEVPDEQQRAELQAIYDKREAELG